MNQVVNNSVHPDLNCTDFELLYVREDSLKFYLDCFNCPKTIKFIQAELSDAQIEKNFRVILNSPSEIYYLIINKKNNVEAGFIGVSVSKDSKTAELGFLLKSKSYPKGTAKKTAICLINYLFNYQAIERIKFVISKHNLAAIRACLTIYTDFSATPEEAEFKIGYLTKEHWRFFNQE